MAKAARSKTKEHPRSKYNRNAKGRFRRLRASVKRNGYKFDLTLEDYEKLVLRPCTYCGAPIKRFPGSYWTDRVDSSKGYLKANVVPCCPVCNTIKGELLTLKEAISVIRFLKRIAPAIFTGARRGAVRRAKARTKREV